MTSLTSLKPKTYTTLSSLAKYFIYLYSKKLEKFIFFVTYIRKTPWNFQTPVDLYTRTTNPLA